MSERIFISGVAGFLGSHLADRLLERGLQVSGCDSLIHGGDLKNVPAGVEFHHLDARNLSEIAKILKGTDLVFHAAALGHDGFSVFSPAMICDNVFSSTSNLLSAAAQAGVRRFVYCSSMARYGEGTGLFTEDMDCNPLTPYGVTKLACEKLVERVCAAHGMEWSVCVPHNIIGPRQRYDDPYRNVAAIIINRLLQNQAPIVYGDGEQRRCFSSVYDVTGVLEQLLFSPAANGEIVNVGPDEEFVSINELCMKISRIMNKDIPPLYLPARPLEVRHANCSADKARRLFGYKTADTLDGILQKTVAWIFANGAKPFAYNLPIEIEGEKTPSTWRERLI